MSDLCRLIWCALVGLFRPRFALEAENLVLRHQLNVLQRKASKRVVLNSIDRLLLVGLYRLPPGVLDALKIIRPCPCRKLTLGYYIGGAAHPRWALPTSDRRSGRRGGLARPSAVTNACAPRCSIFDTISADDADAARQTQRHDEGNPAGSIRSASPHIRYPVCRAAVPHMFC